MLGSNFANSPMAFSHWKTQFSDNGVQSYNEVGFELSGKTWSTSQDRMLLYAAESLQSKNWRRISIFLGGLRSPTECLIRWKTIRAGALWTPIQDRRLRNVVMKLDIGEVSQVGISTWAIVALMVGHGRSAESCYDRWDSLKGNVLSLYNVNMSKVHLKRELALKNPVLNYQLFLFRTTTLEQFFHQFSKLIILKTMPPFERLM